MLGLHELTAKLRNIHEGANVALAYDDPLLLSAGIGTEMFDEKGRRFLETVNNVAIAGHCHPMVQVLHEAVKCVARLSGLRPFVTLLTRLCTSCNPRYNSSEHKLQISV